MQKDKICPDIRFYFFNSRNVNANSNKNDETISTVNGDGILNLTGSTTRYDSEAELNDIIVPNGGVRFAKAYLDQHYQQWGFCITMNIDNVFYKQLVFTENHIVLRQYTLSNRTWSDWTIF